MSDRDTTFPSYCKGSSEKCDLHFLVENDVLTTKSRVEKLEENTKVSFEELQKTLNNFIVEVRTYIGSQAFRDRDQEDIRLTAKSNSSDIHELKSSIKSMIDSSVHTNKAINDINDNIKKLTESINDVDKVIVSKSDVVDIVDNALNEHKNVETDKWFEKLPAKVSAAMAVLTFIVYYTTKIVLMLMAIK